jgi:Metallo-beta-lactamase superfamily
VADDVLELADKLWRGEIDVTQMHPVGGYIEGLAEIADGVAFLPSFANVSAFATGDGLVLVDTGSAFVATAVHETLRRWSDLRLDTAIYSHGHIDHVFGVPVFEQEATERGWPMPVVVAHEALPARFDRYIYTAGYNEIINQRQFAVPGLRWPTAIRTAPTPTTCHSRSAGWDSISTTPGGRPTTTPGPGWPTRRCCAAATSSSGPPPMPAIPRRSSAIPGNGPAPSGRWWRYDPRCSSPATGSRWSGPTGSTRR